jgi:hypothetical protein
MSAAHHLLHDHGHLLRPFRRAHGLAVCFGRGEEGGGVDELHRFGEPEEAVVGHVLVVGDHLGGIDPGERVGQGILQKGRGAHGQRRARPLHQGEQVAQHLSRKLGPLEGVGDLVVGVVRSG